MWFRKKRKRRARASSVTKHYVAHKELARAVILDRLEHFNQYYNYEWKRVAIRNTRRSWGSCTSLKNLNFSYKLLFLPAHLRDYVIVHELCHLAELNHGQAFWDLVAHCAPAYTAHVRELREIDRRGGGSIAYLTAVQTAYPVHVAAPALPGTDRDTMSQLSR
jgi:predicted metal-dependent hydrolase